MARPRRVGTTTSKTRDTLLDAVEGLMISRGYAAVTYRAVAAAAEATPSLVQYYFPTLDELFVATIRRRAARNLERLEGLLSARDDVLRALWEFSREEATAALMTEFTALGNHRTSIQSEIAESTEQVRKVQLDALRARWGDEGPPGAGISTGALVVLLTGIPKLLTLEAGVGVTTSHEEVVDAFERHLDRLEPPAPKKRRPRS